jgi:glycosyltransferase involved in cell wall biosynthesis
MNKLKEISLIIPCKNAESKLTQLLESISGWETIPSEIIIIDSSDEKYKISPNFEGFIKKSGIRLIPIHKQNLYPGHARNIGINSSTNTLLAFLDTSTQPNSKWLSSGINLMDLNKSDGVWGSTYYQATKFSTKIFRACTYGEIPIRTFPGSILNKDIFSKCGLFIENTRAGEDGDWMSRAELHRFRILSPEEFLNYDKLNFLNFKALIIKWFRNYKHTSNLPFFTAHKNYYYYGISFIAVMLAYNWNRVLASWDTESIFFIPNITTISAISIFIIYLVLRGIILPKKKGVSIRFLFPINFIFIVILSALLDFTKALAFAYSKFDK